MPRNSAEARTERERQFDLLVETVTDYAIYTLDPQGNVTTWNVGAERIKGYRAEEVVGQNVSRFYTEEDRRAERHLAALATAEREGRYEAEGWRVRRDGSRLWVNAVIYPVRDETGRLTGFVKVTRDITERLRQEDALERARAAALQLQKMEAVGQLTGGVAHDFNNILTSILGLADLLSRRRDIPEAASRQLSLILRAAERGASLTQRLLAFSRRQALDPHPLDVNRLVGGMSDLLRRTLGESIKIETILAGGLWRTFIDANHLESALLNLGINARDAMPDGGKLTIETGNTYLDDEYAATHAEVSAGQYVLIAVTDTGEGMPPDVSARAFEPFYTTKAEGKGTGLGLSQVYGFVKQSGGHIKIYSEPGVGTCVKVYLPRRLDDVPVPEGPQRPDVSILGRGEKILVVEDDEDVRQYVSAALVSLGYRVLEARDAAAALQAVAAEPEIALLFTDLGLPGMNGRRLAEEARARLPGLEVVYATGYARNAIVHNGLVDPGVNLLPKPFTVEALGRKLRQVLEGR
ncbi:MAG TPA: PAS domain S-box protein [Stellaceae bacterium]|nr:PAS domain S-box protein [Stellaceae bacterium]